uniref:Candidate secreted effector n=1 Tax=Meloidogyne incognita TaxID=6306 RepID=A0A914N609_MELIC
MIGIGPCCEPRPSARRLPARRVPQNPARSAGFCTSASPTPHRFTLTILNLLILTQNQDIELILVSFDSARGALSNE